MPDKQTEHLLEAVDDLKMAVSDQNKVIEILVKTLSGGTKLSHEDSQKADRTVKVCAQVLLHVQEKIGAAKVAADDPTRS